jgi:hypothetical protein
MSLECSNNVHGSIRVLQKPEQCCIPGVGERQIYVVSTEFDAGMRACVHPNTSGLPFCRGRPTPLNARSGVEWRATWLFIVWR